MSKDRRYTTRKGQKKYCARCRIENNLKLKREWYHRNKETILPKMREYSRKRRIEILEKWRMKQIALQHL